jgi:DNA ligase-1
VVGDLAETIAHLLPDSSDAPEDMPSLHSIMTTLRAMEQKSESEKREIVFGLWQNSSKEGRFLLNKLITGGFRVGVSEQLLIQALAAHTGREPSSIASALTGEWTPEGTSLADLLQDSPMQSDPSKPYPFCLAYPLDVGQWSADLHEWSIEWKWDGIRCQVIHRAGKVFIWSRGEELITERFPELALAVYELPDGTVLDGELLAYQDGVPLPFGLLQTRITRKKPTKSILQKAPCILMAYDVLEWQGEDIRSLPFASRREVLQSIALPPAILLSSVLEAAGMEALEALRDTARAYKAEGLMLKQKHSVYHAGRKRGDWWKWKLEPYSIDAVLVYAQKGHGRRADLYTDYTFAVWHEASLVTFTKAYSCLTDAEMKEVDRYIKKNVLEKFGPVRTVKPGLVFEIGFEGIQSSPRHKSGVALRFPRILRWRHDKPIEEAGTLQELQKLAGLFIAT